MRSDDLAPVLRKEPAAGVGFRAGQVVAWDTETAENVVNVAGVLLSNLPCLSKTESAVLQPGDVVNILTVGEGAKSWFVLGRQTMPGSPATFIAQSALYEPDVSGWTVDRDGFAEFQDVKARGDLTVNTLVAGTPGAARIKLTPTNFLQVYNASNQLIAEINDTEGVTVIKPSDATLVRLDPTFPNGAAFTMQPQAPAVGSLTSFASIVAQTNVSTTKLSINSAQISALPVAAITLFSADVAAPTASEVWLSAQTIRVLGNLVVTGVGQRQFVRISGAAETRVNNTFANSALTLPVVANATYTGRCVLWMSSAANAAGDAQFRFTFPANATFSWGPHGLNNALASGSSADLESQSFNGQTTSPSGSTPVGLSTVANLITLEFIIRTGATAGSVTLQWAQQNTNANASSLLVDSHMVLVREA